MSTDDRSHATPAPPRKPFASSRSAVGPIVLVVIGVLILLAPFLFLLPMSPLPTGLKILSFVALCVVLIGLCMILLPVAKAVLLNLQLHHGAEEVTASDIKDR